MQEPRAFCRAVMHEYERQWSRASGHAVRHPLRLKMDKLQEWCMLSPSAAEFETQLREGEGSADIAVGLLVEELLPLWRTVQAGGRLPFGKS